MTTALQGLLGTLDLEVLERNLFRGTSPAGSDRVFGGQVIAQALTAAMRTVEGRRAHSLHAYFLLMGDPSIPILYEVDRIRDGKSFTTRRVVAIQHGAAIFSMSVSFQVEEAGRWEHQVPMPAVPQPDDLMSQAEILARFGEQIPPRVRVWMERERAVEIRPTDLRRFVAGPGAAPEQALWLRATEPLPDDLALHQCVLAFASDMTLIDTTLVAHGESVFSGHVMAASLDHALWFHQPFRADRWMLYAQDSPFAGSGRGLARGLIFAEDGTLIASVAQEGLIRPRRKEG
ncbi:MAG TPA: acyl-CoA thioesterase II [Hyphomicrobiales bacterium]|nr:acyl-CoA thioesterase II [Hyphomicrobiales bacterium]